ncbi:MAG TPA: hypothetical protein VIR60_09100 [Gammaproteobacteria bacterium]
MLEFIFFHDQLAGEFSARLSELTVPHETRTDALGFVVSVADDLEEDLLDRLDGIYEDLLIQSEDLLNETDGGTEKQFAAVNISLRDGRIAQASVRPELMNKILAALSFEELNELVAAIADSLENPDDRPFCQR